MHLHIMNRWQQIQVKCVQLVIVSDLSHTITTLQNDSLSSINNGPNLPNNSFKSVTEM